MLVLEDEGSCGAAVLCISGKARNQRKTAPISYGGGSRSNSNMSKCISVVDSGRINFWYW